MTLIDADLVFLSTVDANGKYEDANFDHLLTKQQLSLNATFVSDAQAYMNEGTDNFTTPPTGVTYPTDSERTVAGLALTIRPTFISEQGDFENAILFFDSTAVIGSLLDIDKFYVFMPNTNSTSGHTAGFSVTIPNTTLTTSVGSISGNTIQIWDSGTVNWVVSDTIGWGLVTQGWTTGIWSVDDSTVRWSLAALNNNASGDTGNDRLYTGQYSSSNHPNESNPLGGGAGAVTIYNIEDAHPPTLIDRDHNDYQFYIREV